MKSMYCPNCGKKINDREPYCPYCNYSLSQVKNMYNEHDDSDSNINEHSFDNYQNGAKKKSTTEKIFRTTTVISFILNILCLVLIFALLYVIKTNTEQPVQPSPSPSIAPSVLPSIVPSSNGMNYEAEYLENMQNVTYQVLYSAVIAENQGNLIKNVWYNAIHKQRDETTDMYTIVNGAFVDDFNDALYNLYSDNDFIENKESIKADQKEISALMEKLTKPPEQYKEAYSVLKDYYKAYLKFTETVLYTSGESFQSFSNNFSEYDDKCVDLFEEMLLYLNHVIA